MSKYIIMFNAVSLPGKAAFKGEIVDESEIASGEVENLLAMGAIAGFDDVPAVDLNNQEADDNEIILDTMTKKQLLQFAEDQGIAIDNPRLSNAKIIALIQAELAIRADFEMEDPTEEDSDESPNTEDLPDVDD